MSSIQLLALEPFDATVVITGLVLVMAMLAVLCLLIMLEGKLFDKGEQMARHGEPRVAKATREAAGRAVPGHAAAPAPAAPAAPGVPPQVVAAIAAAVVCTEGEGARVHSIRRAAAPASRRGAWGQAGVAAGTAPFIH